MGRVPAGRRRAMPPGRRRSAGETPALHACSKSVVHRACRARDTVVVIRSDAPCEALFVQFTDPALLGNRQPQPGTVEPPNLNLGRSRGAICCGNLNLGRTSTSTWDGPHLGRTSSVIACNGAAFFPNYSVV